MAEIILRGGVQMRPSRDGKRDLRIFDPSGDIYIIPFQLEQAAGVGGVMQMTDDELEAHMEANSDREKAKRRIVLPSQGG